MTGENPGAAAPEMPSAGAGTPSVGRDLGAVGGGEARLDYLLAEELAVNRQFLARFLTPALERLSEPIALGNVTNVRVRLNWWDEGGEGCVGKDAGENDLEVLVDADGTTRHNCRAPLLFPCNYAVEELASWLEEETNENEACADRLRWRAQLLRNMAVRPTDAPPKPDHPPTVAFTTFCAEWLAAHAPAAIPNRNSLRTAGNGWLWFKQPKGLGYKCSHGIVDLYVADEGFQGTLQDLSAFIERRPTPPGFAAATDTKGNPVLRWSGTPLDPAGGLPQDRAALIDALELAAPLWSGDGRWRDR